MAARRKGRKTAVRQKKAAAPAQPRATMAGTGFLDLPLELRQQIYGYYLPDLIEKCDYEVDVKDAPRSRNAEWRALMDGIMLRIPEELLRTCRILHGEVHTEMLKHTLLTPRARIVVYIKDLDFRPLINFLNWAHSEGNPQKAFVNFSQPKVIAQLNFSDEGCLSTEVFGRWLGVRRKDVTTNIEYRIGDIPTRSMADRVMRSVIKFMTGPSQEEAIISRLMWEYALWMHVIEATLDDEDEDAAAAQYKAGTIEWMERRD
ncbi:hypothetical protein LTR22_016945 [Elasticomyces elasticus]|nr:hypothetical protein LTR22_016945 [Elasticomyces elasticus]KAK4910201.1 hypothetical protein LTR49_021092 [Elasticomyces elasticus]KAK5759969.1 hypothetical protein LTS12_009865 [Elasticomyces elasticus]